MVATNQTSPHLPAQLAPRMRRGCSLSILCFSIFVLWIFGLNAKPGVVKAPNAQNRGITSAPANSAPESDAGLLKVAEGDYALVERPDSGAVIPFEEPVFNFRESWTLWRAPDGQYRVRGIRRFEAPQYEVHTDRFEVQLSRDLSVTSFLDFAKLKWVEDSGPLSCEFLPNELHCSSGGSDPKRAIQLQTHMEDPYGLLWPLSPFSLSGIAREVERDPEHPAPVELVTIEQPGPANPVDTTILKGRLGYLGEEQIQAAGQKWLAHKFSLKVPLHPQFLIWTSPKGLLLALAVEHRHKNWAEEGIRLENFHSSSAF